jgi:HD-GYP domain-containing protein (c-di-GMP phosphodiesterase class II)
LHELTEKRLNHLSSLRKIDSSINNSKELDVTLGVLLEQTCTQLQADAADVLLCSQDGKILQHEFGQGFNTPSFDHHSIRMNEGPAGQAAQTRELIQIPNLAELGSTHRLYKASQKEGFVSYYAVPLLVRAEIKGVMEVFFRKEFKPDRDWINFLETLAGQAAIAIEQVQLFVGLQRSNDELVLAYDETIEGWVRALDLRDKETEGHSLRVAKACVELSLKLGIHDDDLIHVRRGALLHDIGKVGVPDHILLKPGLLSDEEWKIMRGHPQFAKEMLSPIQYLRPALDIPYSHHERWDGTGYPRGLKGDEIPLTARIFSVIDVWDALSNDRPYRKAWSKEEVLKYLKDQAGFQFDPRVVKAFLQII